jgi:branched-chain amino acid transport system ATP-binding protein
MSALLEVDRINTFYGDSHILFDVSLQVEKNEVVALLGRNGAGKSTMLKTLMGLVRPRSGRIALDGTMMQGRRPHAIAALGLQLVPEERRIFGGLSVEENLVLAGLSAKTRWPLERVWETFPRLRDRRRSRGTDLSGGEQQMLAIARALVREPKVLLLDEPFEGLAPIIVRDLVGTCRTLAEAGQTILIVEQNIAAALSLAHRVYIINNGHIVDARKTQVLREHPEVLHGHLGVERIWIPVCACHPALRHQTLTGVRAGRTGVSLSGWKWPSISSVAGSAKSILWPLTWMRPSLRSLASVRLR